MSAPARIGTGRPLSGPHEGGSYVSELQRARLLEATFAVVAEQGYGGLTVRKVAERAGVSSKTFYDLFSDREDCFLAAFEHAVDGLGAGARAACERESQWMARVRAGLAALLGALDEEPAVRRLVFVEASAAGPRVLARRARVMEELTGVVDGGRAGMKAPGALAPLTAEGVVGGAFGVLYARLSQQRPAPLIGLLGPLMAMIVLPYRGSAAAARELARPAPESTLGVVRGAAGGGLSGRALGSIALVDFRLTIRTQTALAAVAELDRRGASPNNREVSEHMGVADQGQISRLMMRLQDQGLLENRRGHGGRSLAKAWRLTPHGQAVIDAHRPLASPRRVRARGEKLVAEGERAARPGRREVIGSNSTAAVPFRLTARTHLALTAIEAQPAASNVEIAKAAGVKDQGQISKLLARLETRGLIHNTGGATAGIPNAWHLTPKGEEIVHASRPLSKEKPA